MGSCGKQCDDLVSKLGRRLVTVTGEKREGTFLRQRVSIAIQRGNALACRGSFPTAQAPPDDF